jgi:hypothetical protein
MHAAIMPGQPIVAMCVVRMEARGASGVLITVTTAPDITKSELETTRRLTDPGAALSAISDFLRDCQARINSADPGIC